ncbi:MAG: DUF998 domain-containing protein [Candidatus Izemoplasmataceae bacterium]
MIRFVNIRFTLITFTGLFIVMFILPFYSFTNYSVLIHTTSHLGAQGSPNAWIMNSFFILIGLAFILEHSLVEKRTYYYHKLFGVLFGLGLIGSALFRHAPLVEQVQVNLLHDQLHSVFASLTGFSFTMFALGHVFTEKTMKIKMVSLLIVSISIGFSMIILNVQEISGIIQRFMFIIAFSYSIYLFENKRLNIEVKYD